MKNMRHTWNASSSNDKIFISLVIIIQHNKCLISWSLLLLLLLVFPHLLTPFNFSLLLFSSFLHSISFRLVPLCRVNVFNIFFCCWIDLITKKRLSDIYMSICVCVYFSYYQRNRFVTCAAHDVQTNNNLLFIWIFFLFPLFVVRCFAPPISSFKPDFSKMQWRKKLFEMRTKTSKD